MVRSARRHLQQSNGAVGRAQAVGELLLQLRHVSTRGAPCPTLAGLRKRKLQGNRFPWSAVDCSDNDCMQQRKIMAGHFQRTDSAAHGPSATPAAQSA